MEIIGRYNSVEVFTDQVDNEALRQIYNLLNNPGFADSKIAIMPDVHVGKGSVVGFTMTFNKYIIPSVIGVDIGCGIDAYKIGDVDIDLQQFDEFIKTNIPSGRQANTSPLKKYFSPSDELLNVIKKTCPDEKSRVICSVGSLGREPFS